MTGLMFGRRVSKCSPRVEACGAVDELNAAIGVLECAKLELYRRVVAMYEDGKIKENGDVFLK